MLTDNNLCVTALVSEEELVSVEDAPYAPLWFVWEGGVKCSHMLLVLGRWSLVIYEPGIYDHCAQK